MASVAAPAKEDGPPPRTSQTGHSILIGYGRVGSLVGAALKEAALPFLVIEDADKTLAKLKEDGVETVAGSAANADVFSAANRHGARSVERGRCRDQAAACLMCPSARGPGDQAINAEPPCCAISLRYFAGGLPRAFLNMVMKAVTDS